MGGRQMKVFSLCHHLKSGSTLHTFSQRASLFYLTTTSCLFLLACLSHLRSPFGQPAAVGSNKRQLSDKMRTKEARVWSRQIMITGHEFILPYPHKMPLRDLQLNSDNIIFCIVLYCLAVEEDKPSQWMGTSVPSGHCNECKERLNTACWFTTWPSRDHWNLFDNQFVPQSEHVQSPSERRSSQCSLGRIRELLSESYGADIYIYT